MRITGIIAFAAAFAALTACAKEQEFSDDVSFEKGQEVTLSVTAGVPEAADSKVTSSHNTTENTVDFKWAEGDKIKVTVGSSSAEFTLLSGSDGITATFQGLMPASGSSFDVQYPVTDPDITTQTYSDSEAMPHDKMKFAKTGCSLDDPSITLTAQYSGLKLNLYGTNKTISKIVVTNTTSDEDPKPTYTLNISGGKELSTDSSNPTAFFIVVPTDTYDFSVEVFDNADTPASICSFATTSAKAFTEGKILNMKAKAVKKITLSGAFSVDSNKQVYFSGGNLYFDTSDSTFYFENAQYAYDTDFKSSHVSYFNFAHTSGTSEEALKSDIKSAIDYETGKIYATLDSVLFTNEGGCTDIYADDPDYRGWYTPRSNFKVDGETGKWRTLSQGEFWYLLGIYGDTDRRTDKKAPTINGSEDCCFALVKVNGTCGMLIFPDIFTWPENVTSIPETFNAGSSNWNDIDYSVSDFTSLENSGCVFLPTAGYRSGTTLKNPGDRGDYWSCAHASNSTTKGGIIYFTSSKIVGTSAGNSYDGRSIRLVVDAE